MHNDLVAILKWSEVSFARGINLNTNEQKENRFSTASSWDNLDGDFY